MTEVPVRIREAADLVGCVAVLRRVHEISGCGWITPRGPPGRLYVDRS